MNNLIEKINQYKEYYMNEYDFFDGEYHCIFNILEIKENYVICSLNKAGKFSVQEYDLYLDKENNLGGCIVSFFFFTEVTIASSLL